MDNPFTYWFRPGTNPVRTGVYQVLKQDGIHYQYWNNREKTGYWGLISSSKEFAELNSAPMSNHQFPSWRGFSSNLSKSK